MATTTPTLIMRSTTDITAVSKSVTRLSAGFAKFTRPRSTNVISFNHIYNIGQGITDDMGRGLLQHRSQCDGNQVLNNKIHESAMPRQLDADGYAGQGIYLDENTSSALVENNLVYRTSAVVRRRLADHKPRACPTRLRQHFCLRTFGHKQEGCDHRLRESCNLLSPTT